MKEVLNESLIPLLNDGKISIQRVHQLVYIKDFIDRVSTKEYIPHNTAQNINEKYGVLPSVITWGDYFQTEMATSLLVLSDADFQKAVETVKFDMLASYTIFYEKESSFFKWVEDSYNEIISCKKGRYTEEEEEILHLKILKDYYSDLGITDNFTESELKWLESFNEAEAI